MAAEKQKKIYQVAKELNVASPAIIEFLEDRGFEVTKSPKHMSPMNEEMYVEVIKKFDPSRWQQIAEAKTEAVQSERRAASDRARTDQLQELLDSTSAADIDSAKGLIRQVEEEELAREKTRLAHEALDRARKEEETETKRVEEQPIQETSEVVAEPAPEVKGEPQQDPQAAPKAVSEPASTQDIRVAAVRAPGVRTDAEKEEIARRRKEIEAQRAADDARRQQKAAQAKSRQEQKEKGTQRSTERRPSAPGDRRPADQRGAPRPPTGGTPRPPQARPSGPPVAAAAPSTDEARTADSRKRRPTKADMERIEKQKKLLAAQKQDKTKRAPGTFGEDTSRRRKVRPKKKEVSQSDVDASIRQTLALMDTGKRRAKRRDRATGELIEAPDNVLQLTEFVSTQELANLMDVETAEVIKKFFMMGKLVTINQRLEHDLIELIADEFGFQVEFVSDEEEVDQELAEEQDSPEDLKPRPPVVTVMGHVDHGKTSLLDHLRKTTVIAQEHGGITQHIGAYEVNRNGRSVTFLDTPGHEAFTAMRARGAQVTDVVILVVAADDQVRPQTLEAISHAQSAGVPIVVAINKIDKPQADPEKIRKQLAEHNVLVEQWGGKVQSAEISAKFGQGVDTLIEEVLLASDILELKANPNRRARATVVETRIEKGRGVVATVIVTNGTLKVGDFFVAGQQHGKVRSLLDENNQPIDNVGPARPAQVVGFSGAPQAGDTFVVFDSEREVKDIAMRRQLLQREQTFRQIRTLSLDQISQRIREGEVRELPLIIKGDADGSIEAICDQLQRLATKEVAVKIMHRGVGAISESDVLLAAATGSIILGFHVHPNLKAREYAMRESVDIRVYRIIYEMENDIREALEGMLRPDTREEVIGLIEVRDTFKIPSAGTIAGCFVVSGAVKRSSHVRLLRDGRQVWAGSILSLKRFKNDASEVKAGYECGILLAGMNEVREGDTIEVITIVEVKRKLEQSIA